MPSDHVPLAADPDGLIASTTRGGEFDAPSAGPAPWCLYRLTLHTAVGMASVEPCGATRWDFAH